MRSITLGYAAQPARLLSSSAELEGKTPFVGFDQLREVTGLVLDNTDLVERGENERGIADLARDAARLFGNCDCGTVIAKPPERESKLTV